MNPSDEKEEANNQLDEKGDYIFRFRIDSQREGNNPDEPLVDLVRCQLADLLKVAVLTYNGKRVKVTGFQFLNDTEREHEIWVSK